ncbi:hypothetical protein FOL46_004263 [Perkinsus olseni]|uniref:Uncharacterized protein n=1 Tax=Perkinsus olseni TaxID=32597 RepID=A0A7J6LYV2_PEROL|nr:hypothetical protein FOL46_004263 [Perkinsus olseni]
MIDFMDLPLRLRRFLLTWWLLILVTFTSIYEVNGGPPRHEPAKLLFEPGTVDFGLAPDLSVQRRSVVVTNAGRQDIILVDAELSDPENDITITDDDGDSFPIRLGRRQKVTLQLQLVPSFSTLDKVEEVTTTVRFISAASAVSDPLFIRHKPSKAQWGLQPLQVSYSQADESPWVSVTLTNPQATSPLTITRIVERRRREGATTRTVSILPASGTSWPLAIPPGSTVSVASMKSLSTVTGSHVTQLVVEAEGSILGIIPFKTDIRPVDDLHFNPPVIDFGSRRPDDFFSPEVELRAQYSGVLAEAVEITAVTYEASDGANGVPIEVKPEMTDSRAPLTVTKGEQYELVATVRLAIPRILRGVAELDGVLLVHTNLTPSPIRLGLTGRVSSRLPLVYYPGGELKMQYWPEDGLTTRQDGIQLSSEWGIFQVKKVEVTMAGVSRIIKAEVIPAAPRQSPTIRITIDHSPSLLEALGREERMSLFSRPVVLAVQSIEGRLVPIPLRLYTGRLSFSVQIGEEQDAPESPRFGWFYDDGGEGSYYHSTAVVGDKISLIVMNNNPFDIIILDGIGVYSDGRTVLKEGGETADLLIPADTTLRVPVVLDGMPERNITIKARTSRGQSLNLTAQLSWTRPLTTTSLGQDIQIRFDGENDEYTLVAEYPSDEGSLVPSGVREIRSKDTRLEFTPALDEATDGVLARGRFHPGRVPVELDMSSEDGVKVLASGSLEAQRLESLARGYTLREVDGSGGELWNDITILADDWEYTLRTPWIHQKQQQQRPSILAPYQGELIALRLAPLGGCRSAKVSMMNPLKDAPIEVQVKYIASDAELSLDSSGKGDVLTIPPRGEVSIPAIRFCRLDSVPRNGVVYILSNYTVIEAVTFDIPSISQPVDDVDEVPVATTVDVPIPPIPIVEYLREAPLSFRLHLISSIAAASTEDVVFLSMVNIPLAIPRAMLEDFNGSVYVRRVEFRGGGCATADGFKLNTSLCCGGGDAILVDSSNGVLSHDIEIVAPLPRSIFFGEHGSQPRSTPNATLIISIGHDNSYRLEVPIVGVPRGRFVALVESTLKEVIDAWPIGQAKTYLTKKLAAAAGDFNQEFGDGMEEARALAEFIELLDQLLNVGTSPQWKDPADSSEPSLGQIVVILAITGLASISITWKGSTERRLYKTRQRRIDMIADRRLAHSTSWESTGQPLASPPPLRPELTAFFEATRQRASATAATTKRSTETPADETGNTLDQRSKSVDSVGQQQHHSRQASSSVKHSSSKGGGHKSGPTSLPVETEEPQPPAAKLRTIQSAVAASMAIQGKPSVLVGQEKAGLSRKKKDKCSSILEVAKTKPVVPIDKKKVAKPKRQHGTIKAKVVDRSSITTAILQSDDHVERSRVLTPVPPISPTPAAVPEPVEEEGVDFARDVEAVVKRSDSVTSSSLRESAATWEESSSGTADGGDGRTHMNTTATTTTVQPFEDPLEAQQLSASLEMLFKQAPVYDLPLLPDDDDEASEDLSTLLKNLDGALLVGDQQQQQRAAADPYEIMGPWRGQEDTQNHLASPSNDAVYPPPLSFDHDGSDALYEPVSSWLPPPRPSFTSPTGTQQHHPTDLPLPSSPGYGVLSGMSTQEERPAAAMTLELSVEEFSAVDLRTSGYQSNSDDSPDSGVDGRTGGTEGEWKREEGYSAQEEDLGDMRKMVKFLSDRCHQLEAAYNDRETGFREEMEESDMQHKKDMALAMAEISELESRVEALSEIKHELNFRVRQLEAGEESETSEDSSSTMSAFGEDVYTPHSKSTSYSTHTGSMLRLLTAADYLPNMPLGDT